MIDRDTGIERDRPTKVQNELAHAVHGRHRTTLDMVRCKDECTRAVQQVGPKGNVMVHVMVVPLPFCRLFTVFELQLLSTPALFTGTGIPCETCGFHYSIELGHG